MTSNKNILFISYDGMTDPLGQSQVIPYMQGLSKAGYNIYLLSCEKKLAYKQHNHAIAQLLSESNIKWIPLSYTKSPPVLSTLFDIIKLRRAARKLHRKHKIALVHTRPGVPALVGLWMKKTMGVKFLNDIREFYADSRVEGGMWNTRLPVYARIYDFFKRKETEAVAQSDGIVCLTYAAESIIKDWEAYHKKIPLTVIPCSADLQLFDSAAITQADKIALQNELNITPNDFIVSYLGSIGGWYLTSEMMQFCKMLIDRIPATRLLFISPHRHNEIRKAAGDAGIDPAKIIIQKAGRQQVPGLLSLSNYSIFFIKPCYSKQSSSPTKHGEIMAMGIPLITNSGVGDVEMIVERYNAGIVIREFDENSFAHAVEKLATGLPSNPETIRLGAKTFYSLDAAIEKYIVIYSQILNH